MDKYIFEQFITEIDNKDASKFFKYLVLNSQEKIEKENKKYLIHYPQQKKEIELILETEKDDNGKFTIKDFKFHHKSKQEWEFKIVTPMKSFDNTYVVKRSNNTGSSCIRVINEGILDKKIKSGTIIKGQVCGIVMIADIFRNEEDYRESVPTNKDGNKTIMNDGYLIPYNLITNNSAKLTEEERNKKNHSRDNLLTFKSKLKNIKEQEISMFNMHLPNYYTATIETTYGDLDIIIPNNIVKKYKDKVKNGNIIIGELLLSCNVCIDKYKKMIKKNEDE